MNETTRIQHPTCPDVQREVPAAEVNDWLEAGWVAADPEQPEGDPDPKVDPDPDPDVAKPRPSTTKTKEGAK